jgi:hypothetical protein
MPTWTGRLEKMSKDARTKAQDIGPMCALWDAICDAEALLEGRPTILAGDPDDIASRLIWIFERDRL